MRLFSKVRAICLALALLGSYLATPVHADEIRPALLDIKEQSTGLFAVTWKVPTRGNRILAITARLPESLEIVGTPVIEDIAASRIERATYKNNGESLVDQTIVIDGLKAVPVSYTHLRAHETYEGISFAGLCL